jgi:hypothetical protein
MQLPEFRLYYDDNGDVLFYTCEKPEGKYIVIDLMTYHACRNDVKVVDGKLVSKSVLVYISKIVHGDKGTSCHRDDVSIVYDSGDSIKWQLKYE